MSRALDLARRGLYTTDPNPRVGCVIAHGERVVGEGWHRYAGEPHAEIHALAAAGGGAAERLTFDGRYNARAAFSPDGSRLAFVHESDGEYRIAVMGIGDERIEVLTNGRLDESPTFAPNGRLILYATTERGRSALAAVSIDGRFRQRLSIDETGVRDPAWSPRLSQR
jgi:TolB protein